MKPDMSERVLEQRKDIYDDIRRLYNHIAYEWSPDTARALFEKLLKEAAE